MNKKLLVRFVAISLAIVTVIALFAPVAMATEASINTTITEEDPTPAQTLAPPDEETFPEEENPELGNVPEDTVPAIEEDPMPDAPLPDGFEYVKEGDSWVVAPMEGTPAGLKLIVPTEFNAEEVTVFCGNLETKRVQVIQLAFNNQYIDRLNLEPGYYVLYSGNYAYADDSAHTYEINGGQPLYVYIGNIEDFNNLKYSAEFVQIDNVGMLNVPMGHPSEFANVIDYGSKVTINNSSFAFPTEYELNDNSIPTVTENTSTVTPTENELVGKENDEKEEEKKDGLFVMALKRLWFPVLLLVGGQVWLMVIRNKKENQNEKRIERDHKDSGRFE